MAIPTQRAPATPPPEPPPPEPTPVERHLTPPQETSPEYIIQMQKDALEREKASNAVLTQALAAREQSTAQMTSMLESSAEQNTALHDLIRSQVPAPPEVPEQQPAAPQPGQQVDITTQISQMEARILAGVNKTIEPFAQRLAVVSNENDRRAFERRLTEQVRQPMRLTAAQDEEIQRRMVEHPTMQYADAANFLQGDLAIVVPGPAPQEPQPAPQPPVPGAAAPTTPPVPTPRVPLPAPAATPPGPPANREQKTDYEPHELIRAARNAENAGDKADQEFALVERLAQGTMDPFHQFGDIYKGQKKTTGA